MKQDIIINAAVDESRIAIVEDGALAELFIERKQDRGIAGNIYKGKVVRVLPGMQAAFVDIGMEKAAFLHVSDLHSVSEEVPALLSGSAEEEIVFEDTKPSPRRRMPIEKQLSAGQEILVQAAKDPLGLKGARLTSYISLPGRYLVFMPTMNRVGTSRRIKDEKERERLKGIVDSLTRGEGGFILRTACEGRSKREIRSDFQFLTKLWNRIQKKAESVSAPALVHQDLDLISRTIRDFFGMETRRVCVDHAKEYRRILDFVGHFMPRLKSRVSLYSEPDPIMDHFGIEAKIHKALDRKIWLRSGGYIAIEQTEALTAVDVNTGRFVGKRNQEETVLRTNLEAAQEVVRQLRLRNLGGLIIIDFIDMERDANRRKVYDALKNALKQDKARTKILKISPLGLVEMTRQRTRESLGNLLLRPCPYCEGRGRIKSHATIAYEILRAIKRELAGLKDSQRIVVRVHPDIANFLYDDANQSLDLLEKEISHKIFIKVAPDLHHEKYEIGTL